MSKTSRASAMMENLGGVSNFSGYGKGWSPEQAETAAPEINETVNTDKARKDVNSRLRALNDALNAFMDNMEDDTSLLIQALPGGLKAMREISKATGVIEDNLRHLQNQLMNGQNWNHKLLEDGNVVEAADTRDMAKALSKFEGQVFRDASNKSVVEFDAHGFIVEDEKTGKLIGIEYKNLVVAESLSEAKVTPAIQKVLSTIQQLRGADRNLEQFQLHYKPSGYLTGKAIENAINAGFLTSNGRSKASVRGTASIMVELTPAGEQAIEDLSEGLSSKDQEKVDMLRNSMPGFVGPDFAKKASDEDILAMADLQDERADVFNNELRPIYDKIDKLRKKYRLKPVQRS